MCTVECPCADRGGLGAGLVEAAAFGFDSPLLLGEGRVEVGAGGRLRRAGARWDAVRLGSGLRTRAGGRSRHRHAAIGRMHDRAALAFGDFALDLFANLAGSLSAGAGRTFFVVEFGLGPLLPPFVFVFASGLLLFARVQPIGKGGSHCDNELEVVENPVHGRKGE